MAEDRQVWFWWTREFTSIHTYHSSITVNTYILSLSNRADLSFCIQIRCRAHVNIRVFKEMKGAHGNANVPTLSNFYGKTYNTFYFFLWNWLQTSKNATMTLNFPLLVLFYWYQKRRVIGWYRLCWENCEKILTKWEEKWSLSTS
jgi:hypothetical protein